MENLTDKTAAKYLGKKVDGSLSYNPSLLVAVPRFENRKQYDIENDNLPFEGGDVWHCYEFSAMTKHNIPVTRLIKLKYNCNNEYLVESKSLKLYLNSFNMSKFGQTIEECLSICKEKIQKDLSEKLETNVEINFLDNNTPRVEIYSGFTDIMNYVDEKDLVLSEFKEAPNLLEVEEVSERKSYYLTFDSLRSNCRVTHQPDFGDIFIYYKSNKHIIENSLVKYLTSFRSEYHFHEECCEMIFKRLFDILNYPDDELFVCALYTRRGGIDICPTRWSKNCKIKDAGTLTDLTKFARHGIKQ